MYAYDFRLFYVHQLGHGRVHAGAEHGANGVAGGGPRAAGQAAHAQDPAHFNGERVVAFSQISFVLPLSENDVVGEFYSLFLRIALFASSWCYCFSKILH